jgi:hypothetical protein
LRVSRGMSRFDSEARWANWRVMHLLTPCVPTPYGSWEINTRKT